MEEMSGWGFSELKTEATENYWLFIQYPDNSCYVCVNFIMSLQYVNHPMFQKLFRTLYIYIWVYTIGTHSSGHMIKVCTNIDVCDDCMQLDLSFMKFELI